MGHTNLGVGDNGGLYRARCKTAGGEGGEWSPWMNLGGGLKLANVEVERIGEAQPSSKNNSAIFNSLINYLLDGKVDEPMTLLMMWREGRFDEVRNEWPEAPAEIFPDRQ